MAKLTSDLQDLRKKDVKALESLVLEIRENGLPGIQKINFLI